MMTIKEYAQDIGKSVAEVLRKCRELGITVDDEDTLLEEEDIIELDNVVNEMVDDEDVEELSQNLVKESESKLHKEKVGKKAPSLKQNNNKNDLKNKKKAM